VSKVGTQVRRPDAMSLRRRSTCPFGHPGQRLASCGPAAAPGLFRSLPACWPVGACRGQRQ
jgi:hypothetical protein